MTHSTTLIGAIALASFLSVYATPTPSESLALEKHDFGKRCTATINSAADITVANLACTTININSFTMPAGKTFDLSSLVSGAVVNLNGDITFAVQNWEGPLFKIGTASSTGTFTFNGNGHTLNGQGAKYWDGKGSNDGVTKPHPMVRVARGGGSFNDVVVLNSPAQAISIGNTAQFKISGVTVDDSAGNLLGHNTDCFDISANDVTIIGSTCKNQDDCLALNRGSNINFSNNKCFGGHGISIGSVTTGNHVSGVTISGNTVSSSTNGLRIKTMYGATSASVTDVTYTGNIISGISEYGVIIHQNYVNTGTEPTSASNGVTLGPVTFSGTNNVAVNSDATKVYVLCGTGCTGTWNWSGLKTTGGSPGSSNYKGITGYTVG